MTTQALPRPVEAPNAVGAQWVAVAAHAPGLASTIGRYLDQIATFLAPASVLAADQSLRNFAGYLVELEPHVRHARQVDRDVAEDYKVWLAAQTNRAGRALAPNTRRQRIGMLRAFFERLIEWDWPDAPMRNPFVLGDLPAKPEPLPKFLSDADAARLMAVARAEPDPLRRLVVEILARTGLRVSELCDLAPDAIVRIGDGHWLRVPLGKLRNDRYVPLHPDLVDLLTTWVADHHDRIRRHRRLLAAPEGPLNRHRVARTLGRMARTAGIGHVTPHQLRHTLATQAINRGMRLEAIAALLGHKSLEMTLVYARIADRVVADEYAAVSEQIDALYGQQLPAAEPHQMTRLRQETHARLLGNGLCTRPALLDCRMESVCETCTYFQTGPDFVPVLLRRRDHARDRNQPTGQPCSTSSSTKPMRTPLDTDHPYNTDSVRHAGDRRRAPSP